MALDGKRLVGLARAAIEAKLDGAAMPKTGKSEKRGVFVTLHSHPGRALRGCVGFAFPVFELEEAVVQAALSAGADAFISKGETPDRVAERLRAAAGSISILTPSPTGGGPKTGSAV